MRLLLLILTLSVTNATAQQFHDLQVEVIDTVETAYDILDGEWVQDMGTYYRSAKMDSIGLDRVLIFRFWYNTATEKIDLYGYPTPVKKRYIKDLEVREYPDGRKGTDFRLQWR